MKPRILVPVLVAALMSGCATMTKEEFGDILMLILSAKTAGAGYNYQQALYENQLRTQAEEQKRFNRQIEWQLNQMRNESIRCRLIGGRVDCYTY